MDELNQLKSELKAWERKFRAEHDGRDPTKDDTRRDPAIATKYKLYRSLSKTPANPLAAATPRTKARKRMRGEDIPITPSESARKKRTRILSFTKASQALSSSSHTGDRAIDDEGGEEEGDGGDEDEEEALPESPIKPSRSDHLAGPSSGVFRPLFLDSFPSKRRQVDDSDVFRSLFAEEISAKRRRDNNAADADIGIVVEPSQDAIDASLKSDSSNSTALRPPSPVPDFPAQSLKYNPKVKATWFSRKKSRSDRPRSKSPEQADDGDDEISATTVKWRASGSLAGGTEKHSRISQDEADVPEYKLSEDDFPHAPLFHATKVLSSDEDDSGDERRDRRAMSRHLPTISSTSSNLNRLGPVWAAGESEEGGDEWDSTPEWAAEL